MTPGNNIAGACGTVAGSLGGWVLGAMLSSSRRRGRSYCGGSGGRK